MCKVHAQKFLSIPGNLSNKQLVKIGMNNRNHVRRRQGGDKFPVNNPCGNTLILKNCW